MRVLSTGVTGYFGSRQVPRLVSEGHEVQTGRALLLVGQLSHPCDDF